MESEQHPFSWQAIARIITSVLVVFLVWKSLGVFLVIVISMVISAALYPIAKKLHQGKIPMILSVILVIILLLIPLVVLVTVITLTFDTQFPQLIAALSPLLEKFHLSPSIIQNTSLFTYMRNNFASFLNSTEQVGLAVIAILTTIFLTFYFMLDAERLFLMFIGILPRREHASVRKLFEEIALVTGQYIRGNLIISIICILVIYGGLALLHIPFALPLAIFTGILDLLPVIGPVIGAIPALILGFAISPIKGILVLVLYLAYKETEDVIIGPAIYNKVLDLSPALVFLSVVIGAGVFGIIGAFLALPVAASIPVIVRYRENFVNRHAQDGAK